MSSESINQTKMSQNSFKIEMNKNLKKDILISAIAATALTLVSITLTSLLFAGVYSVGGATAYFTILAEAAGFPIMIPFLGWGAAGYFTYKVISTYKDFGTQNSIKKALNFIENINPKILNEKVNISDKNYLNSLKRYNLITNDHYLKIIENQKSYLKICRQIDLKRLICQTLPEQTQELSQEIKQLIEDRQNVEKESQDYSKNTIIPHLKKLL